MFKGLFKRFGNKFNLSLEDLQRKLVAETLAGAPITHENSLRIAAVYACVRVLSEGVAQLPIHIYRKRKDGRGKDKASDHALYGLLHDSGSPNDFQTAFEFKEFLQGSMSLRGNGYAFISRDHRGNVLELLPLHPDKVQVEQDANLKVTYTVTDKNGGQSRKLPADKILHLRGFGTDGLVGLSPIQLHREGLALASAAEKHGAKFLGNFAQPSGVLSTKQKLKPEEIEKVRDSWRKAMGGDKSFGTAVVDNEFTWSKITMTNEEAQYLDLRKFQRNEIATIYRVPPHMIGDLEKATFSNIEEQGINFVVYTLMPWLKRWEGRINKQLLTPKDREQGYFAEFLVDALLRGDFQKRVLGYKEMVYMGSMSPNDVREKENENPREGGDIYLTPVNMTTNPEQNAAQDSGKQQEKEKAA